MNYYTHQPGSGQGEIQHWSISPARNLGQNQEIILLNSAAPSNILMTLWKNQNSESKGKNLKNLTPNLTQTFTIIESQHDQLARQLILLAIALDKNYFSQKDKVFTYLEVYGNTFIRSATLEKLDKIINDLIKAITDSEYNLVRFSGIFEFESLKQRDIGGGFGSL